MIDESNEPLAFANVVLKSVDSTYLTGTTTNLNGEFNLLKLENAHFITISSIGYTSIDIVIDKKSELGTIQLKPNAKLLGEVVVKGQLPKTQIKGEALVTQIQGTILTKAGSATDVLKKIPGIISDNNGFSVFGKGTAIIYINGKLIRDNSELESLNSHDIKDVEVINNPGARYNANVNAVIRIQTTKKQGDGLGFNLRSSYYQSENTDLYNQIDFNYRHKKLDIFATLGYSHYENLQKSEIIQSLHSKNTLKLSQQAEFNTTTNNLTPTIGLNYQFNNNHSMGLRYRLSKQLCSKGNYDTYTTVLINNEIDDKTHTLSNTENNADFNHQINLYYNGKIGKLGIDFNADILNNGNDEKNTYNETSELQDSRIINTLNKVDNKLYASKLILSYPIFKGVLALGTEYTYTNRKDAYSSDKSFISSSISKIEENNATAFIEYKRPTKFGALTTGLRYEHVAFDYFENNILQKEQSRKFNNIYPNAALSAKAGKFQFQLSYSVKTKRPTYNQLKNAALYIDRYSITKGNPALKPEILHNMSFVSIWKYFQFVMNFQVVKDAIAQAGSSQENSDNTIMLYYTNLNKNLPKFTAMISASPTIGFWSPRIALGFQKQWFTTEYLGENIKLNKVLPYYTFNNGFKIPKGFMANIDFALTGSGNTLLYETVKPTYQLNISLMKSFFKDTFSIELKGSDILNKTNQKIRMYSNTYSITQVNTHNKREFSIHLRYKFNSTNSKYKGTGAGASQKSRM